MTINEYTSNPKKAVGWNTCWENNVYKKGRHLNRYPYHAVVGFILSKYGSIEDRLNVNILEIGCGAGNNLWFAAREGFRVAGIDGSKTAIKYAKKRFEAERLKGDLRVGSFVSLPWPDKTFDLIIDRGSLTTTRKQIILCALQESKRVLKSEGQLQSIIYSWEHPGRRYGKNLGDHTYGEFSSGYFHGLGTAFFADRSDIDNLYGELFSLNSVIHTSEKNMLGNTKMVNSFWKVECVKK
jgi:SAM-dependent methyltransferase